MSKLPTLLPAILLAAACGTPSTTPPTQATTRATTQSAKTTASRYTPATAEQLTIMQRTSAWITGLDRRYRIKLGDITGKEVLTRVLDHKGNETVGLRAMRVGDTCEFVVGDKWITLGLARLHNRLIGEDYAVFYTGSPEGVAQGQIQSILEQIENSTSTFVRAGNVIDGPAMADHLRSDVTKSVPEIRSARQFVLLICSNHSSSTPKSFVRFGNKNITLATWLGATR